MFHRNLTLSKLHSNLLPKFYKFNQRFIGQGASFQLQSNKVRLRGKFLPSRNEDMPTLLWFPDVMEPCENWEKWFAQKDNKILDFRNVWIVSPRNFGDSDHHKSFDLEDMAYDVDRFLEEKQLSIVTVGGHGHGAKVASAFGSYFHHRTSGVMCLEGGPMDHSFHEAWQEVRDAIVRCSEIPTTATPSEVFKVIDSLSTNSKWKSILKQNVLEGKSGGSFQWRFNMEHLAENIKKDHRCDLSSWSNRFGLYTGRAFVLFADQSRWIFLATNTIPFYKFFLRLEGKFPSNSFNYVQTLSDDPLNHWIHEHPKEQTFTVMNRMTRFIQWEDGVHVLLADRSEVGWFAIPERESKSTGTVGLAEYIPEHVHHNYKFTDAYKKSKERRGKIAANPGEFRKGFSNQELW